MKSLVEKDEGESISGRLWVGWQDNIAVTVSEERYSWDAKNVRDFNTLYYSIKFIVFVLN